MSDDCGNIEAAVLGSMVMGPSECIGALAAMVSVDAFWRPEHKILFETIADVFCNTGKMDLVLLQAELRRRGDLKEVGGVEYLVEIAEAVPSAANWRYYGKELLEQYAARNLDDAIRDIQASQAEPGAVMEKIRKVQEIALNLESPQLESPYMDFSKEVQTVADNITDRNDLIETGFCNIDNLIHGFQAGELIVLAGRTREGKSAMAVQIGLNAARAGHGVFMVPLEMTPLAIMQRIVCGKAVVNLHQLASGFVSDDEIATMRTAANTLAAEKLNLTFSRLGRGQTVEQVAVMVQHLKKTRNIETVIIDYLQLMDGQGDSVRTRIVDITRKLKLLAVKESVVVIILSQLKRNDDAKHEPQLSDLKESGSIEQDADMVLMLWRPDLLDSESTGGLTKVFIRKNRRGPQGVADLVFVGEYVRFENATSYPALSEHKA